MTRLLLSPQDVVSCSVLAQGCMGGFDYLIAGRYAMDQGVVAEHCNAYDGSVSENDLHNYLYDKIINSARAVPERYVISFIVDVALSS